MTEKNANLGKNNNVKSENARMVALQVLHSVASDGAYSNIALSAALQKSNLSAADRGLATELVYGTLRMQGTIDYCLGQLAKKPISSLPLWILLILRMGAYQLLFMDRIPPSAAINESVKLAKKKGHPGTVGLTNGMLRNLDRGRENLTFPNKDRHPAEHLAYKYSHPLWLAEKWVADYGFEAALEFCKFNNTPSDFTLRVNFLDTTRDELLADMAAAGIEAEPLKLGDVEILPEAIVVKKGNPQKFIAEGLAYPQQFSSMLAAHVLSPTIGANVIDACAAPGGKTTHLAQLMEDKGEIRAFDIHEHKAKLIMDNARRLRLESITASVGDSRKLPEELVDWADFALVDAPCSGLGVLRTRPDARWQKSAETCAEMAEISFAILESVADKVKVGGVVLYSTCTVDFMENQGNVEKFLAKHSNYKLVPIEVCPELFEGKSMVQLLPQIHGTDGFFFARMMRVR